MRGTKIIIATALLTTSAAALAQEKPVMRQDAGAPVSDNQNSRTAGEFGGVLLEDFHLIEKLARFDRERIPERVVHARGVGAHGEFVSDGTLEKYTYAGVFDQSEKTPVFVRFSTVIHPSGSPEALRDPRGFATKFYTKEGNWDLVGNNLPVFFIRDAIKFPDMVHSLKPSPVTNKQDPNRFFDFFSHIPESTHMLTQVYTDLGTPKSLREMDGFGVHALRLINDDGDVVFAKFQWKSRQGVKTMNAQEASKAHFNYATDDLYQNIGAGNFPVWDLFVKILKPEDIEKLDYNPFDATKDWYDMPDFKVGTMTLNRMPDNFFESTEQAAFSPGVMIPGIETSPDRLLQGRLFSYADTQRYRVGVNYQSLDINKPMVEVTNGSQNGSGSDSGRKGEVNYQPSRMGDAADYREAKPMPSANYALDGIAEKAAIKKKAPFAQAGIFYSRLSAEQKANLISNLSGDLGQVRDPMIKKIMVSHFYAADADYGTRLAKAVNVDVAEVQKLAAKMQNEFQIASN